MLKHLLKAAAGRAGYRIIRATPASCSDLRLARLLDHHEIDLVFDVGANTGQYGRLLRRLGYERDIVSFEPLKDAHARLRDTASDDDRWHVAEPMALGAEAGSVAMEVAGNVYSSSLLKMAPLHVEAAPASRVVRQEEVRVARLDDVAPTWLSGDDRRSFLKIDVQGYEQHVLDGASGVLDQLLGLQLELSLDVLYEGQANWLDLIHHVGSHGFVCVGIEPGFTHPVSGKLLQMDGVFFRSDSAPA